MAIWGLLGRPETNIASVFLLKYGYFRYLLFELRFIKIGLSKWTFFSYLLQSSRRTPPLYGWKMATRMKGFPKRKDHHQWMEMGYFVETSSKGHTKFVLLQWCAWTNPQTWHFPLGGWAPSGCKWLITMVSYKFPK